MKETAERVRPGQAIAIRLPIFVIGGLLVVLAAAIAVSSVVGRVQVEALVTENLVAAARLQARSVEAQLISQLAQAKGLALDDSVLTQVESANLQPSRQAAAEHSATLNLAWEDTLAGRDPKTDGRLVESIRANPLTTVLSHRLQAGSRYSTSTFVVDRHGLLVAYGEAPAQASWAQADWWAALKSGAGVVFTILETKATDQDEGGILIAVPLRDEESTDLLGAAVATSRRSVLETLISEDALAGASWSALMSEKGTLIAATSELDGLAKVDLPRAAEGARLAETDTLFGDRHLYATASLESSDPILGGVDWYVAAGQSQAEALQPLRRTLLPALVAAAAVTLLLICALYAGYLRPMARAISHLRVGAEELLHGDGPPIVLQRSDELGLLAATFNAMAAAIRAQLADQEGVVQAATIEMRRRASKLQAAVEVSQALNGSYDLIEMMTSSLSQLQHQLGYAYAGIYLADSARSKLTLRAQVTSAQLPDERPEAPTLVESDTPEAWVARHWTSRILVNAGTEARYFRGRALESVLERAVLPLVGQGELLGVLDVRATQRDIPLADELNTLQLIADQIASAIANARAFRRAELQSEQQQRILALGQRLNRLHDVEAIMTSACRQIQADFGYDVVHIAVSDDVSWTIHESAARMPALAVPKGLTRPARSGLIGQALSVRQPRMVANRNVEEPGYFDLDFPAMASEAAVPLFAGKSLIGALGVLMEQPDILSQSDLNLLALVAETLGSAIANARLLRDVERNLAELDRLYRQTTWLAIEDETAPEVVYPPEATDAAGGNALNVPLYSRGQLVGEISVAPRAGSLSADDQTLVGAVANQLALSVENSRLFRQTRDRLRETEALLHLAATLSTTLEEKDIYQRTARSLAEQLGVHTTVVYRWEPNARSLLVQAGLSRQSQDEVLEAASWYRTVGLTDRPEATAALESRSPRLSLGKTDQLNGERSVSLAVPLMFGQEILGLVELERRGRRVTFGEAEVRLAQAMANQSAVALQNARLTGETKARVAQLTTLNRVGQRLAVAPDLDQVFAVAQDEIHSLTEVTGLHVYLFDLTTGALTPRFRFSDGSPQRSKELEAPDRRNDPLSRHVFRSRRQLIINAHSDPDEEGPPKDLVPRPLTFAWAGFPLVVSNEAVGVLALEHSQNTAAFLPDEVNLLATIANSFAVAVNNQVQFDRTTQALRAQRQQRLQLETAARVAAAASSILEVDVLIQQAVELIQEAFQFYFVGIFLADYGRHEVALKGGTGAGGHALLLEDHRLQIGDSSAVGLAVASGEARIEQDLRDQSPVNPHLPRTHSQVALPLRVRDFIIGALSVYSVEEDRFDDGTVQVLQTMADQLAIAINNAQLLRDTQAYSAQLQLAAEVGRAANTILDRELLGRTVVELIRSRFDLYHVGLYLADGTSALFYAGAGGPPDRLESLRELTLPVMDDPSEEKPTTVGVAMSRGTAIFEPDLAAAPQWSRATMMPETRSALTLPLITRSQVVGALSAQSDRADGFTAEEMSVLEVLADQLAVALDNARLFSQTERSLRTSTGLYEAGRQLTGATHVGDIWATLTEFVTHMDAVSVAGLLKPDADGEQLEIGHWWTRADGYLEVSGTFAADDLNWDGRAVKLVTPGEGELSPLAAFLAVQGVAVAAIVPVRVHEEMAAVLLVGRPDGDDWEPAALQPLQTLADQAAVTLANQRLLAETNALYQVSAQLNQAITQEDLTYLALTAVAEHAGVGSGRFVLFAPRSKLAVVTARYPEPLETESSETRHWEEPATYALLSDSREPVLLPEGGNAVADAALLEQTSHHGVKKAWLFPLRSQYQLLGYLALDQVGGPSSIRDAHRNFAEAVLRQLNTALENLRLLDDTLQRARDLITLNQIGALISGTLDLEELAHIVRAQLGRLMPVDLFILGLFDTGSRRLTVVQQRDEGLSVRLPARSLDDDEPLLAFLQAGMPLIGTDETPLVIAEKRALGVAGIRSSLWMPMARESTPIGFLAVGSTSSHAYEDSQLHLFRSISTQASLAVTNAQLFRQTQDNLEELRRLLLVSQATASSIDATARLENTIRALDSALPHTSVAIYLNQESENSLTLVAASNKALFEAALPLTRELTLDPDGSKPVVARLAGRTNGQHGAHGLLVPLRLGQRLIGVVSVQREDETEFNEEDLRLLQTLSGSLAATIESGRLFLEIQAANERLREIDRLKSQFLANMSHELRTPLNSIIGFSRLMLKGIDGPVTSAQEEDLASIHHSGQHLLRLINDILDMSKIEAGKMVLTIEDVDVVEIARKALATVSALLEQKPITVDTDLAPDLPAIEADPVRLRQILLNLLSNAAKFTDAGSIGLGIAPDGLDRIHITVSDTGPGIAGEHFDVLFREFEQLNSSATREIGGTGLGLPITKRLVEMHGGEIWVESEIGRGSTFHVSLPVRQPAGKTSITVPA